MTFNLTHCRHDPAHCLAPGLFRSLKRGDREKLKLHVIYQHGNDQVEFKGSEPLGADDLRLLQGLVALAGPKGIILRPEPQTDEGQQLRLRLFDVPEIEAAQKDALVVKDSFSNLLREVGFTDTNGGAAFKHVRDCIERLFLVTIFVGKGSQRVGFRLLSSYASDEADGRLLVALNPRIAEAILGTRPYTRIDMTEVRALPSDPARLIHQRLCGWVKPGSTSKIDLDTAVGYIYHDPDGHTPPAGTIKRRRHTARKALKDLEVAGWAITEYGRSKFEVRRPPPPE